MNFFLVGSCLFLVYINVIATEGSKSSLTTKSSSTTKLTNFKEAEKLSYPKKVNSSKKTHGKTTRKKVAADITEKFKDLPDDDLAFIKELDKQFKLHGGKVKIKVENKNVTASKNSKRTIDHELGYGYAHNGYNYDPPKYMFYPYSQHNIDSHAPGYYPQGEEKTEVSIEPSLSYELKSQSYVTQNGPQIDIPKAEEQPQYGHTAGHQQYEEPVIVLRIPGPAKYATHLQMLLQKYLEIRAAQYLHILEEAELGNLQQQQHLQQLDYGQGHVQQIEQPQQVQAVPEHQHYAQQVEYQQQSSGGNQAGHYPEIDHVYSSYKNRHQEQQVHTQAAIEDAQNYYGNQQSAEEPHQPQYAEHQYSQPDPYAYQQQAIQEHPQFYYTHQQQYAQPSGPPAQSYHQVLLLTMTQPQQAEPAVAHGQAEQHQQPIYVPEHKESSLSSPIAENNPRPSHTKVVFTNKNEHPSHEYQIYQLPSIKPNERHAPTSTPPFHQDFQQVGEYQPQYSAPVENGDTAAQAQVVAITQRPYNYHAHNVKARARGRTAHTRRAVTAKEADSGLEKIREFVRDKLGAETGSAVEFKTTQIIDG